jgi:hypothetical protein
MVRTPEQKARQAKHQRAYAERCKAAGKPLSRKPRKPLTEEQILKRQARSRKWRQDNPEKHNEGNRRYRQNNPEKYKADYTCANAKRRAKRLEALAFHLPVERTDFGSLLYREARRLVPAHLPRFRRDDVMGEIVLRVLETNGVVADCAKYVAEAVRQNYREYPMYGVSLDQRGLDGEGSALIDRIASNPHWNEEEVHGPD